MRKGKKDIRVGPVRESNPGPLAPKATRQADVALLLLFLLLNTINFTCKNSPVTSSTYIYKILIFVLFTTRTKEMTDSE